MTKQAIKLIWIGIYNQLIIKIILKINKIWINLRIHNKSKIKTLIINVKMLKQRLTKKLKLIKQIKSKSIVS